MNVSKACKNYFNAFKEISNFKKNDNKTNALAALKIISYLTVLIPAGFAVVYGAASLYGRVSRKHERSPHDNAVHDKAKVTILEDKEPNISSKSQEEGNTKEPEIEMGALLAKYFTKISSRPEYKNNPSEHLNALMSEIEKIRKDAAFQTDSEKYINEWKLAQENTLEEDYTLYDQAVLFYVYVYPKVADLQEYIITWNQKNKK